MIFGVLDPDKIWHALLTDLSTSHVRCSHFTLGSPESHFQQYYSYILLIIYVISEENKPTCPPTWKCHHTNLQNAQFFSSDWRFVSFIQMLVPLKRAGFWLPLVALKTPGCDVWQLGCWASNVIASVQWPPPAWMHASSLFFTDHLHRTPHSAEIQSMFQQAAVQLVRIADFYSIDVLLLYRAPDAVIGLCR